MINFKNKKLSIDIASILITLIPLCIIFVAVSFLSGGLGVEEEVNNRHVSEQGEFSLDRIQTPGWTWRLFGWEPKTIHCKGHRINDYFSVTEAEILEIEDINGPRFSTRCKAVVTYNTGEKVTREYTRLHSLGWWLRYPSEAHCHEDERDALDDAMAVANTTVVEVKERTDVGWTYYKAVIKLQSGHELVREYVEKDDDRWYRYPAMSSFDDNSSEYWRLKQAYDSRCAQSIFGATTQPVATESE